jgi:hypothetical protein
MGKRNRFKTREELFKLPIRNREIVEFPELQLKFCIQELSAKKFDDYLVMLLNIGKENQKEIEAGTISLHNAKLAATVLSWSIIDETTGELVFTPEDIEKLEELPSSVLYKLFSVATRLSHLIVSDKSNPVQEVKDEIKNAQKDSST